MKLIWFCVTNVKWDKKKISNKEKYFVVACSSYCPVVYCMNEPCMCSVLVILKAKGGNMTLINCTIICRCTFHAAM